MLWLLFAFFLVQHCLCKWLILINIFIIMNTCSSATTRLAIALENASEQPLKSPVRFNRLSSFETSSNTLSSVENHRDEIRQVRLVEQPEKESRWWRRLFLFSSSSPHWIDSILSKKGTTWNRRRHRRNFVSNVPNALLVSSVFNLIWTCIIPVNRSSVPIVTSSFVRVERWKPIDSVAIQRRSSLYPIINIYPHI